MYRDSVIVTMEADVQTMAMRILTGILFCILTACATEPAHIPLKPELSQRVNSSNGVILVA